MVIVKLMGGLGNQMFQYAVGKALATELNTIFKLDLEFLLDRSPRENFVYRDYDLDIFKLRVERAVKNEITPFFYTPKNKVDSALTRLRRIIRPYTYYHEPHFHFDPAALALTGNVYLEGYWQTPKYFEKIEQEIRNDFAFKKIGRASCRERVCLAV